MTSLDEAVEILRKHERKHRETRERIALIEQGRDPNAAHPAELPTWVEYTRAVTGREE
jgi:hypothetical protein